MQIKASANSDLELVKNIASLREGFQQEIVR